MTESTHILVVDDSPTQLQQLQMVLENEGFGVQLASGGMEAIEQVQQKPPSLVITDLQMPGMDGLELVAALRSIATSIPVIVTTAQGDEKTIYKALRAGAATYVPKRDVQTDLIEIVRQVLSVNRVHDSSTRVAKYAVENSITLCLENDETLVPSVIERLEEPLVELDLFDEGERMQIAMALDEALLNAIVHGNLEVDSNLREVDDGTPYFEMIKARKLESPYRERRVTVSLAANNESAVFTIQDQGPGFDTTNLRDATDDENLERAGGRGLLLIRAFMDEVNHNETGNRITMVKRKPASESTACD